MAEAVGLGDDSDLLDAGDPVFYDLLKCFRGRQIEGGISPVVRLQFIDNKIYPFHMMKKTIGVMGDGHLDLNFFPRKDLFRKNLDRHRRFVGEDIRGREKEKSKKKYRNNPGRTPFPVRARI